MPLNEYGKYKTINGNKVNISTAITHEEMLFYYGQELATILGIQDKQYEELSELLKNEKVFQGLTDNNIMPSGNWHSTTGKCLYGNTGGVMGNGDSLKKNLANFDINIDE